MDTTQSTTDKSTADSRTTAEALRDELAADLPPTTLIECPECDRVGLPERIAVHDCL
jgi:hypothetical protein